MIPVKLVLELRRPNSWFLSSKQDKGSAVGANPRGKAWICAGGSLDWKYGRHAHCVFALFGFEQVGPCEPLCFHVPERASWRWLLPCPPVTKHLNLGKPGHHGFLSQCRGRRQTPTSCWAWCWCVGDTVINLNVQRSCPHGVFILVGESH